VCAAVLATCAALTPAALSAEWRAFDVSVLSAAGAAAAAAVAFAIPPSSPARSSPRGEAWSPVRAAAGVCLAASVSGLRRTVSRPTLAVDFSVSAEGLRVAGAGFCGSFLPVDAFAFGCACAVCTLAILWRDDESVTSSAGLAAVALAVAAANGGLATLEIFRTYFDGGEHGRDDPSEILRRTVAHALRCSSSAPPKILFGSFMSLVALALETSSRREARESARRPGETAPLAPPVSAPRDRTPSAAMRVVVPSVPLLALLAAILWCRSPGPSFREIASFAAIVAYAVSALAASEGALDVSASVAGASTLALFAAVFDGPAAWDHLTNFMFLFSGATQLLGGGALLLLSDRRGGLLPRGTEPARLVCLLGMSASVALFLGWSTVVALADGGSYANFARGRGADEMRESTVVAFATHDCLGAVCMLQLHCLRPGRSRFDGGAVVSVSRLACWLAAPIAVCAVYAARFSATERRASAVAVDVLDGGGDLARAAVAVAASVAVAIVPWTATGLLACMPT
jgi:hypothetical protein